MPQSNQSVLFLFTPETAFASSWTTNRPGDYLGWLDLVMSHMTFEHMRYYLSLSTLTGSMFLGPQAKVFLSIIPPANI